MFKDHIVLRNCVNIWLFTEAMPEWSAPDPDPYLPALKVLYEFFVQSHNGRLSAMSG
jgi:hypothetical protein